MAEAALNLELPVANEVLDAFKPYEHFSKCLLDAYAVVDMDGKILKCNALLSQVTGLKTKQILKSNTLTDMLVLTIAGKPLAISELLNAAGPTRFDEVTATAIINSHSLNLIIGVYPFSSNGNNIGAFMLLRDVTAETNLQDKYKDKATQSITDNLTGLFNRAYFSEYLSSQVAALQTLPADAPQRTMSVVMLDIDFFKKINDVYGHQAGDYVLSNVGRLLKLGFRKTDVVARYGGEEFLAILPSTELVGAATASEKIRLAIANFRFDFNGTIIPVTISSGVSQITIGKETPTEAVARADAALYFAKKSGRNRVGVHNGAEPVELEPSLIKPNAE